MFAQTFFKVKIWIILCLQDKSLLKLQGADEFATGINPRGLSFLKYNRISFRGHYNSFRDHLLIFILVLRFVFT